MRILIFIVFLVCIPDLFGQQFLLPYLKDGKYGIADETGKMLIEPKYEATVPSPGLYLIKVKLDG